MHNVNGGRRAVAKLVTAISAGYTHEPGHSVQGVTQSLPANVERAVIVVGAAGTLPFRVPLSSTDVIVTGEIRHHDALTIRRLDATAIALGHWASERPVLPAVTKRLEEAFPGIAAHVSSADRDMLEFV